MPARTKRSSQDSAESLEHRVSASLDVNELTRAGSSLTLELFANKKKLGKLVIGQGAMY